MATSIFSDPPFIRRNILLNNLHSNFKTEDFSEKPSISNHSDLLRATYHSLAPLKVLADKKYALSLIYLVLTTVGDACNDIDWMYLERILIHFINLQKSADDRLLSLLTRNANINGNYSHSAPQQW